MPGMPDSNTSQVLEAIKESGERQERAMQSLGGDIRRLLEVVVSGRPESSPSSPTSSSPFILLFGVAAIIFGLMAPMYVMLQSQDSTVAHIIERLEADNDRERINAAATATINESLREIETQFDGIRIAADKDEYHDARGDAKVERRLDALEERVFKMSTGPAPVVLPRP